MNVLKLTEDAAIRLIGKTGAAILRVSKEVAEAGSSGYVPPPLTESEVDLLKQRYGPNAVAVYLLLDLWTKVPWRQHEGEPSPRDHEVTRVSDWSEALSPTDSPTWVRSLEEAGYHQTNPRIRRAWEDGSAVGLSAGGNHAKFLAAAMAGELAQFSPERQLHFFLDMLPWVLEGYWPCGWDEEKNRLRVL